ncbi:MAG TPA: hypothetical protein PLR43_01290 [Syntrophales bacterium]|nr:hypothetical protein [Syntrophales bacterium]
MVQPLRPDTGKERFRIHARGLSAAAAADRTLHSGPAGEKAATEGKES